MTRKKTILIGIAGLIALWIVLNALSSQFIGAPVIQRTATSGGAYGFSNNPSLGLNPMGYGESSKMASDMTMPIQSQPPVDSGQNIIQTASVSMVVSDVEQTANAIEERAKNKGGFVSNKSLNSAQSGRKITNGYVQARVAQPQLQSFLEELRTLAVQVTNIQTASDDVTTQVRDLQSEIRNLESQESQLRALFENTTNVTQILEIERELTRVRTQIDQKKSSLSYYERASALSTVTINLALDESELPTTPADRFQPKAVWNSAIRGVTELLQNIAYLGIYLIVFSIVWVPLLIAYILFKRYRNKPKSK